MGPMVGTGRSARLTIARGKPDIRPLWVSMTAAGRASPLLRLTTDVGQCRLDVRFCAVSGT